MLARDTAPSRAFSLLEPILTERGFEVMRVLGDGKPIMASTEEVQVLVADSDVVLLGMSAPAENAAHEIIAGLNAVATKKTFGFYGDVPKCWNSRAGNGAWFADLAKEASFYFGVSQPDADAARIVFPDARLVGTGNPLREEAAFPKYSRAEVRARFGIADDEKLVLAPGGRFPGGLDSTGWTLIMNALAWIEGEKFRLIITPHPGDRVPFAIDPATSEPLKIYDQLVEHSTVPTRIVYRDEMRTSEILPGADIVIEFGSTVGIEAAYLGIPDITLSFSPLLNYWEKVVRSRTTEQVDNGVSEMVEADVVILTESIQRLLTPDGFRTMRLRQQRLYPKPEKPGMALQKMADALNQIASTATAT